MPEDTQNPSLVSRITGEEKDVSMKDQLIGGIYKAGGALDMAGHAVLDGIGNAATAVGNKYSELTKKDPKDEFIADVNKAGGAINKAGHDAGGTINKAGHDAGGTINKAGHDTLDGVEYAADSVGNKYSELTSKSEQRFG